MKWTFLILNSIFLLILACGQGGNSADLEYSESEALTVETARFSDEGMDNLSPPIPAVKAAANQEVQEQKIIKTGNLRWETNDLSTTRQRINQAIATANGYISNDQSGKGYDRIYQTLTVRIPTQNFQSVIESISKGVPYFEEKTISQRDVTEEFVDLSARLNAKNELENRYLDLLKEARSVKDMLEIERELSNIREEIERTQGRLQYLQNRVSYSTLTLNFYTITTETGVTISYGSKMWNALKNGWNGISVFFLGILHIWPFLILVGVGAYFLRRFVRNRTKKA